MKMRPLIDTFKKSNIVLSSVLAAFILLLIAGCSSDDPAGPNNKVPVLSTAAVSEITQTTAKCGGTITSDCGATVTARGVCWSTNPTPMVADNKTNDGAGAGSFISSITGLSGNTSYYLRAYATNSAGTGYGMTMAFTTDPGPVIDIDGNIYQTIRIGNQWWMTKNLKVSHYRNGDSIPNVTDNATWASLATGAYCSYNDDVNSVATYGRLYNWYAVIDGRNIAPEGWHVSSDAEWQTVVDYLGGDAVAGGKMKETGTAYWISPNTGATNACNFSALPGGNRSDSGYYYYIGYFARFWSSSEYSGDYAWYRNLGWASTGVERGFGSKHRGFSVRCVKD